MLWNGVHREKAINRERARERERQTETETETARERERERQTERARQRDRKGKTFFAPSHRPAKDTENRICPALHLMPGGVLASSPHPTVELQLQIKTTPRTHGATILQLSAT